MAPGFLGSDLSPGALKSAEAAYQKQQAAQTALQQKDTDLDAQTAIKDINSGNYAGAWSAALDSSSLYGTNYNSGTTDPLLQAMESSTGLEELDPTKKWSSSDISSYYQALYNNPVYHGVDVTGQGGGQESFGKNPYGTWGAGGDILSGKDASINESTAGDNSAPDVERFASAEPKKSFLEKFGPDIAALGVTALSFGVAAPALAGALGGTGLSSLASGAIAGGVLGGANTAAVDAITGQPITAGGILGGALGGAAGGGLTKLAGGAINNFTGLGNTISTGIAGAGIGAGRAALTGGSVGIGALAGGVGGAIQGSGIGGASNKLINGGANYAIGGLNGAAAGALMGQGSQGAQGAQGAQSSSGVSGGTGANGTSYLGAGLGGQGNNGNMADGTSNSDSSLASAITGALPGVIQGASGVYGAQNAAEAQTKAIQSAIGTQQTNLGNISNIWGTQQKLGQGADTALGSALGTNGQPANYSNFMNMPGYQFAVQQGTQAIQRQAAALGNAYTPNTAAAVGQYVTNTAAQDYNTYISQLMGAAGLGNTANQGLQTANQTTANNISQLQVDTGQAQGLGILGASNAVGGLFGANGAGSSLLGAGAGYLFGNRGGGSSGGYGGGNSSGVSGGSSSDPFAGTAEANNDNAINAYNQNNVGNTGIDPSTGQSWASGVQSPTLDQSDFQMPSIDTGNLTDGSGDVSSFLGDF